MGFSTIATTTDTLAGVIAFATTGAVPGNGGTLWTH